MNIFKKLFGITEVKNANDSKNKNTYEESKHYTKESYLKEITRLCSFTYNLDYFDAGQVYCIGILNLDNGLKDFVYFKVEDMSNYRSLYRSTLTEALSIDAVSSKKVEGENLDRLLVCLENLYLHCRNEFRNSDALPVN